MDLKTLASVILMLQDASPMVSFIIIFILIIIFLAIISKTGIITFVLDKFKKTKKVCIDSVSEDINDVSNKLDSILENTKEIGRDIPRVVETSVKLANTNMDKELYRLSTTINHVSENVKELKEVINRNIDSRDDIKHIKHVIDSTGRGY